MVDTPSVPPSQRDSLDDHIPIGRVTRHSIDRRGSGDPEGYRPTHPKITRTLSLIFAELGENFETGDNTVDGVKNIIVVFNERSLNQMSLVPAPTPCTKRPVPARPRLKPKPARFPGPRDATLDDTGHPSHVYALSFPSPSAEASSEEEDSQLLLSEKDVVDLIEPMPNVYGPEDDLEPAFFPATYSSVQGQWSPASPRQSGSYHLDQTVLGSSRIPNWQTRADKVEHEQHHVRLDEQLSNPDRALRTSKQDCSIPIRGQARPNLSRGLSYMNASEDPLAQQTPFATSTPPSTPQATGPTSNPSSSSFSSGLSYATQPPPGTSQATVPLPEVADRIGSPQSSGSTYGDDEDEEDEADEEHSSPCRVAPRLRSKPSLSQVRPPNLIDNVRCRSPEPIEEVEVSISQIYERTHGRAEYVLAWRDGVEMSDDGEESVHHSVKEEEVENGDMEDNAGFNGYWEDNGTLDEFRDACHDGRPNKEGSAFLESYQFPCGEDAQWGRIWASLHHNTPFNMDVPLPESGSPSLASSTRSLSPLALNEDGFFATSPLQLPPPGDYHNMNDGGAVVASITYNPWVAHPAHSILSPLAPNLAAPFSMSLRELFDYQSPVGINAALPAETLAPIYTVGTNPLLSVPCLRRFRQTTLDEALHEFTSLSKMMNRSKIRTIFADRRRWPRVPPPGMHRWDGVGEFPAIRDASAWPPRLQHTAFQSIFTPSGLLHSPRHVQGLPWLLQPDSPRFRFDPFAEEDNDPICPNSSRTLDLLDCDGADFDELDNEIQLVRLHNQSLIADSPVFWYHFRSAPSVGLDSAGPALGDDGPMDAGARYADQSEFATVLGSWRTFTRRGDSRDDASARAPGSPLYFARSLNDVRDQVQSAFRDDSSYGSTDLEDGDDVHRPSAAIDDEDRDGIIADFMVYTDHEGGITDDEIDEPDAVNDDEAVVVNGDDSGANERLGSTDVGDGMGDGNQTDGARRPVVAAHLGLGLVARFSSQSQAFQVFPLQASV
ncbi:hypothetical protein EST38_g14339 [Candolleomyces aberdarensis]|uniref:Uncharacterized protein n=1 Tax=Candolleomyces aberdarensis TaxID=2316362 RepID=A0A4Q2CZC8_9AGAR|nr:hypothetical protein EST38_g14339 [Candolleomyces aberdarensis]